MRKNHLLTFLAVTLFFAQAVLAQQPPPSAKTKGNPPKGVPRGDFTPPREAPIKWETFTAPDKSFSILLPTKPQHQQRVVDSPTGKIAGTTYISIQAVTGYSVTYADTSAKLDAPEQAKDALDQTRDLLLAQTQGKLLRERNLPYGNYPGRELKVESPKVTAINRYYYVNNRVYIVQVVVPAGMGDPDDYGQNFFDSFKILKAMAENLAVGKELPNPPPPPAPAGSRKENFSAVPVAPPAPAASYAIDAWKEMEFPQAGFAVSFPVKPQERDKSKAERAATEYRVVTKDGTFSVTETLLPAQNGVTKAQMKKALPDILKGMESGPYKWLGGKEIELAGNPGIEFKYQYVQFAEISWQRMLFVNGRMYAIVVDYPVNKADLKEPKLFMDSFKLLTIAMDNNSPPPPAPGQFDNNGAPTIVRVSGGVLQGNAQKKVQPRYPPDALSARVQGAVQVAIIVSETGDVISAEAVNGDRLLREGAVEAAKQWKFNVTELSGKPVKVQGILTFNFTLQ